MNVAEKRQEIVQVEQQKGAMVAQGNSEAGALMTIIERISMMPDLDLDRVERLFAMHQQMLARSAEQTFNESMAMTQAEIQSVTANKKNVHTKSVYADIDAIHEAAKPVWTKNGFSVVTRTAPGAVANHIKVICEVRHSAGHKETYEDDWPLDTAGAQGNANKTAIQGKGSTSTYARRYTELMIFDIAIKRLDKDGYAPQKNEVAPLISDDQLGELVKAMAAKGITMEKFCQKMRIGTVAELESVRFPLAMKMIDGTKGAAQ